MTTRSAPLVPLTQTQLLAPVSDVLGSDWPGVNRPATDISRGACIDSVRDHQQKNRGALVAPVPAPGASDSLLQRWHQICRNQFLHVIDAIGRPSRPRATVFSRRGSR